MPLHLYNPYTDRERTGDNDKQLVNIFAGLW